MTTTTTLPTNNEAWGFWGTMHMSGHAAETAAAWTTASEAIARATSCSPEGVRDFLDSRHGRHFADDVVDSLRSGTTLDDAVSAAVARWMGWRISRSMSRETGIPHGLPYLTGLVADYEIMTELPY